MTLKSEFNELRSALRADLINTGWKKVVWTVCMTLLNLLFLVSWLIAFSLSFPWAISFLVSFPPIASNWIITVLAPCLWIVTVAVGVMIPISKGYPAKLITDSDFGYVILHGDEERQQTRLTKWCLKDDNSQTKDLSGNDNVLRCKK